MKKVNEVFFGEHGLTSTSANHLANIAQEKIVSNEAKLKNLNFVTTTVDIVGSPENSGKVINKGYDETRLSEVRGLLSESGSHCCNHRQVHPQGRCLFEGARGAAHAADEALQHGGHRRTDADLCAYTFD